MLTNSELLAIFDRLGIPDKGRIRIDEIRRTAPVRRTEGGSISVKVRYASMKMGFVLEAEAFHTEYAAIRMLDYDPLTLEIYPQPTTLNISYANPSGRRVSVTITPDLFVIRRDGFEFIECKTESDLLELAAKAPERFVKDGNRWRSPPAEKAAAELGCLFSIRSTEANDWTLISNLDFLSDYLRISEHEVPDDIYQQILSHLRERRWCPTRELLELLDGIQQGSDAIYSLIVRNEIYFDLSSARLVDPDAAIVFRDELTARAFRHVGNLDGNAPREWAGALDLQPGRRFDWDGQIWEVINVGHNDIVARQINANHSKASLVTLGAEELQSLCRLGVIAAANDAASGQSPRLAERDARLRRCSAEELEVANDRYRILFCGQDTKVSKRTKAYWISNYRSAEESHGLGILGLIRNPNRTQGNRQSRLPVSVAEKTDEIIRDHWLTPTQKSFTLCYGLLKSFCTEKGYDVPSPNTFRRRIRNSVTEKDYIRRIGRKRAYQEEIPYLVLDYTTPRHGEWPFHIAHVDHTPIDLVTLDRSQKWIMKSVWLTLLIDAYSRMILAWYLTFDKPSYRSCMMVIRECVRTHGRLPLFIVSDQGAEFRSTYYETLLAQFGIHKKERPTGRSRHGSIIERMFNTAQSQFIHNLVGNTKAWRHFRQVGSDVNPVRLARWTFAMLDAKLGDYFTTVYHQNHHSTLGTSPQQMFRDGLQISGLREHTFIPFNEEFISQTCPTTPKGRATVTPRGVQINYHYYTCPEIAGLRHFKKEYPVRYDPFDMSRGSVHVDGVWHKCYAREFAYLKGISEKAMRIASQCIKLDPRLNRSRSGENAQRIAEFILASEKDAELVTQLLRDRESDAVVARLSRPNEIIATGSAVSNTDSEIEPSPLATFKPILLESF